MNYLFINRIIEEQKRKVQREKNKEVAKNILAGITIGSTLGVLLAPKSGKETRADIQEKSKEIGEDVKDSIAKSKEDIDELKNTFAQIKSDIKERAQMGIGPVDDNYTEISEIEIEINESKHTHEENTEDEA